jgi:hypothetical protein
MAFDDEPIEPAPPGTIDNDDFDADSDLASLESSGFTSLNTRVRQHIYEGGRYGLLPFHCKISSTKSKYFRRYQAYAEGRYPLPNDDRENDREAWKHMLLKTVFGDKLYLAPIGNHPQKILDLGTGTGLWALEGSLSPVSTSTEANPQISGRKFPWRKCHRRGSVANSTKFRSSKPRLEGRRH